MTLHNNSYDVVVAGGGTAGTAAAVASARCGARTLLVERNDCLGGAGTMRNVATFCGIYTLGDPPRQVVAGFAEEVLSGLRAMQAVSPPQRHRGVFLPFEPEALKRVLDDLALTAGVELCLGASVTRASQADGRVQTVHLADHAGVQACHARAFVDCTGDGDLAAFAGASTRYGNGGSANLGTLGTRFGGISSDLEISVDHLIEAIAARGFEPGTITKDRSVIARQPVSGDLVVYLASVDYDPRDARSRTHAAVDARRQAWAYLDAIRTIPGCERAYLVSTGPEMGTRESRHLNCRYQLTWADIESRREFADCIALGAWGAEWHDRSDFSSSFDYAPDRGSYQIPLRSLCSIDAENLFCAGRLADGDRKAGAAIRVMGTAMATGQAAGLAAALTAAGDYSAHAVRAGLIAEGALLSDP
ncbi:MAG: FAD-dependent oxidoreductase [Pseudomonadota bacterium]